MERIEKERKDIEIIYKAIDGTEFEYKEDCEEYEDFLNHLDEILSKMIFFKRVNNDFYQIPLKNLELFDYCYLTDSSFIKYHRFFEYYNKIYKNELHDFTGFTRVGFYRRDYSNAMNGGYGFNGWKFIGTMEDIELWGNLVKTANKIK